MIGPTMFAGSAGSPHGSAPMAAVTASSTSSYREACTTSRVASAHPCPLLAMHIPTVIGSATARSASSRMMFADFPPSSRQTLRMPTAARS